MKKEKTENAITQLHCSAMAEDMEAVVLLLLRGADIFQKDCQNRTAFDLAKENWAQESSLLVLDVGG